MAHTTHNGHERGTLDLTHPAKCVGCGCTDREGCPEGCCWLVVDRRDGTGVCSNCPGELADWKRAHSPARN